MGQKVNPIIARVTLTKDWRSKWFADKRFYGEWVVEDDKIRKKVCKALEIAGVSKVLIERYANRVRVVVYTARPGIAIGRRGQEIEKLRSELAELTNKEVFLEIHEVKNPDTDASLVAQSIALQLVRRVSHRRAMKRAIKLAMDQGAIGIKIRVSGRLGGAELSRSEWYKEGKIPLQTFSSNIDYGFAEAMTTHGKIGIKVWICKP